jgi:hypothetical protein
MLHPPTPSTLKEIFFWKEISFKWKRCYTITGKHKVKIFKIVYKFCGLYKLVYIFQDFTINLFNMA